MNILDSFASRIVSVNESTSYLFYFYFFIEKKSFLHEEKLTTRGQLDFIFRL